ncbi:MAG TPA: hypothetical protein PKC59_03820 [Burkholderiaceae bacterium]|uniref:hypothetical protein n=1 Tax=Accumulibacter sp. TaxID=2053492 RepID=UPI002BD1E8D5|nr:hypothetical protein [Accumulibacter sp.]HMW22541.1 hypothetical protein [Burkholderiaceae bacterium]HMW80298.1 hypothetical protein [Accumulibacter sp.]HMY98028.1 hypothetical protein [Burkholderiaceae bacterium]HNG77983.1 hypothetical protein [Burkholderiaceae bacterium]
MPLSGPLDRLRQHGRRLHDLAGGALVRRELGLLEDARVALRDTVTECFLLQRSPDGVPWVERKTVYGDYRDTNPILFDLLSGLRFEITYSGTAAFLRRAGSGVSCESDKYYAFYHQNGTRTVPARPFLPTKTAPPQLRQQVLLAGIRAARSILGI